MFVNSQSQLDELVESISSAKVVAVDTEFMRERTYFPILCLVQIAANGITAAIDPFAIEDLTPLARILVDPSVTKVFHACSQDLEVLAHVLGVEVTPVFDTQLAAAFLGDRMQMGLGALVEEYEGVHLPKGATLTDWTRRPLDEEQLAYAEDDVRYLCDIHEQMMAKLVEHNRLGWVNTELESITDPAVYRHEPSLAYTRLKRSSQLTRRQLGVAREVCAWREMSAAQRDVPRKRVLTDEVVVELCKRHPAAVGDLRKVRGTDHISNQEAKSLVAAVERGMSCPASGLPTIIRSPRPPAELESVLDLMYALTRLVSEEVGVATQLIATRDDLYDFIRDRKRCSIAGTWRDELIGARLDSLLAGELGLTVKDGRVELL